LPGWRSLQEVVRATESALQPLLGDWLGGWWAAQSLDEALAHRAQLPPGGRFVTRQGHVVGVSSLQFYAADSEQEGLLVRQHELDSLGRELRAQHLIVDEARAAATRVEALAAEASQRQGAAREAGSRAVRELSALRLAAQRLEQQLDRARQSRERIEHDLAEVAAVVESARMTVEEEAAAFEGLDLELADRQQAAEDASMVAEDGERQLGRHRDQVRQSERDAQEASFATREIATKIERLDARIGQAGRLEQQSRDERLVQQARLAELSDAPARQSLDAALAERLQSEQQLAAARQTLESLTQSLKSSDEQRLLIERRLDPQRTRVAELQLKEQAARLSVEQFSTLLEEQSVDEAAVRLKAGQPPKAVWLQTELTRLAAAITALGAVNLAALDELAVASERKAFLDAQSADLEEAIATLDDAIRRIDRETRELLQQTYEVVNKGFGQLFPELFGGGEAKLILTGDEILDAGIQVMAQPPGKRNSTIHLLSGGEKALTAIALVFAMFQLNPAPFCLLDEVDAPLDDANTERYARLVSEMSRGTQFLFISHNKIAMEMAKQLVGVTMQESGVSRIVEVDIEEALRMREQVA
jgi:chromosome segregation protein